MMKLGGNGKPSAAIWVRLPRIYIFYAVTISVRASDKCRSEKPSLSSDVIRLFRHTVRTVPNELAFDPGTHDQPLVR